MIRILAIDDDPVFAESIRQVVEELDYVLIDIVSEVTEFKRLVKATVPELLLIDIDLGQEINGIQLAEELLDEVNTPIIFITSHLDLDTTRKAIELFPAAYITKPINGASLLSAISLAKEPRNIVQEKTTDKAGVFLKVGNMLKKFQEDEIAFVEVVDRSCFVHASDGKYELNIRLKDLLKQLPDSFIQIHRSFIVNWNLITEVDSQVTSVGVEGSKLPVGRSYKGQLLSIMNRLG